MTVDECPGCGGYWLDAGEPALIRSEVATDAEREKAAKARQIAHMFRFICPSYHIPGKQDWGAF